MENYDEAFAALKPLHDKHREILIYIRDFCREHNINWCLAYGSALGAQRHGGPIPWDDDTDIYMTVDDYERFRSAFSETGDKDRFYLQENINACGMIEFAKLRLNNSCFIQPDLINLDMHHGIYTDIFILHPAPENYFSLLAGRIAGYYVELKRMALQHYSRKKIMLPFMKLLRLMPKSFGLKTALKLMYRCDRLQSHRLVSWGIPFRIYSRDMIFPTANLNYDGLLLPVPGDTKAYLRLVYGNWEALPDLEAAGGSAHSSIWSTDEDFRLYAHNIHDYSDEIHIS